MILVHTLWVFNWQGSCVERVWIWSRHCESFTVNTQWSWSSSISIMTVPGTALNNGTQCGMDGEAKGTLSSWRLEKEKYDPHKHGNNLVLNNTAQVWYRYSYLILLVCSSVSQDEQVVVRVLHVVKQSRLTGLDEGGEWERSLALNKPHLRADLTAAVNGHQPLVSGTTDLHKEPEERARENTSILTKSTLHQQLDTYSGSFSS